MKAFLKRLLPVIGNILGGLLAILVFGPIFEVTAIIDGYKPSVFQWALMFGQTSLISVLTFIALRQKISHSPQSQTTQATVAA